MNVPCLTLRDNTERPITLLHGSNQLVGRKSSNIIKHSLLLLSRKKNPRKDTPPYWDGKAAKRIVNILASQYGF